MHNITISMQKANVTDKQRERIMRALDECMSGSMINDKEQLIANRKYVFRQIIEMYCSWEKDFDCLPEIIQIGAYNPRYLCFRLTNIAGQTIKEL